MKSLADKPRNPVEFVDIDADQAGQRIDNYLLSHLKGVPRSRVYRLLRKGEVRVNKKRVKPEYRLQAGDQVRIPPVRQSEPSVRPLVGQPLADLLLERVLYEDDALMILNKPSGVAVHGGSGISLGIIEAMRQLRPELHYLELVHRLDRETSGCLMLAKKRSELRRLHQLLREGESTKIYLALVKGRWAGGRREVNARLAKNVLRSGERMVRVSDQGKEAGTVFEPEEIFANASMMSVQLLTGRTHQIRVHAAHIGHPVAGDDKYGDAEFNKAMHQAGLRRLFLHASRLEFVVPDTHKPVAVSAPLDPELTQLLEVLRRD
jgi:23S rRNA pseudouridine955/2504/2580 synthase